MGWTSLFLEMADKNVLIAGSGEVGMRRAKRFLQAGAHVIVLGHHMPPELLKRGAELKPVDEVKKWISWADIVVVATRDSEFNQRISDLAKDRLLNRADIPIKGNVIVPSSFFIGDVQISIFTQGKSPLMARELRKRIEKVINKTDILQMELQYYTRNLIKDKLKDQKSRKSYLYHILKDNKVKEFLIEGKLEDAKLYVSNSLLKFINEDEN